jgi:hypothetical protein
VSSSSSGGGGRCGRRARTSSGSARPARRTRRPMPRAPVTSQTSSRRAPGRACDRAVGTRRGPRAPHGVADSTSPSPHHSSVSSREGSRRRLARSRSTDGREPVALEGQRLDQPPTAPGPNRRAARPGRRRRTPCPSPPGTAAAWRADTSGRRDGRASRKRRRIRHRPVGPALLIPLRGWTQRSSRRGRDVAALGRTRRTTPRRGGDSGRRRSGSRLGRRGAGADHDHTASAPQPVRRAVRLRPVVDDGTSRLRPARPSARRRAAPRVPASARHRGAEARERPGPRQRSRTPSPAQPRCDG